MTSIIHIFNLTFFSGFFWNINQTH